MADRLGQRYDIYADKIHLGRIMFQAPGKWVLFANKFTEAYSYGLTEKYRAIEDCVLSDSRIDHTYTIFIVPVLEEGVPNVFKNREPPLRNHLNSDLVRVDRAWT